MRHIEYFFGIQKLFPIFSVAHLLKHDLIAFLDVVLPDGVRQLCAVVYEVVGPQHVHRGHVARLGKLRGQERELKDKKSILTMEALRRH